MLNPSTNMCDRTDMKEQECCYYKCVNTISDSAITHHLGFCLIFNVLQNARRMAE
jgi:hypothetical protein